MGATGESDDGGLAVVFEIVFERAASGNLLLEL
jgi:hypothetical protein